MRPPFATCPSRKAGTSWSPPGLKSLAADCTTMVSSFLLSAATAEWAMAPIARASSVLFIFLVWFMINSFKFRAKWPVAGPELL